MIKGDLKYSKDIIKDRQKEYSKYNKAAMEGVYKDLQHLKPLIENFYDEYIFYLDYWRSECGYHGWDYTNPKAKEKIDNMAGICEEIKSKFFDIYALILNGIGEDVNEEDR